MTTQLYAITTNDDVFDNIYMGKCVVETKVWMICNMLKLNYDKTMLSVFVLQCQVDAFKRIHYLKCAT